MKIKCGLIIIITFFLNLTKSRWFDYNIYSYLFLLLVGIYMYAGHIPSVVLFIIYMLSIMRCSFQYVFFYLFDPSYMHTKTEFINKSISTKVASSVQFKCHKCGKPFTCIGTVRRHMI